MASQDEYLETPKQYRQSAFKEASMNSTTSIHPPPSVFYKELRIEEMIDRYSDESPLPPARPVTAPLSGPLQKESSKPSLGGRISNFFSSIFHGGGSSSAFKEEAERKQKEEEGKRRKQEVEEAYERAKALGLLPKPTVYVRPASKQRGSHTPKQSMDDIPQATPGLSALRKSTSKKDLQRQEKLHRKVSNLEHKLAEARKELSLALGDAPPVPAIPDTVLKAQSTTSLLPSPPDTISSAPIQEETPIRQSIEEKKVEEEQEQTKPTTPPKRKISKKRKAPTDPQDSVYKPSNSASNASSESEPSPAKKAKKLRRTKSTRRIGKLAKKNPPRSSKEERPVTVVPDGVEVPPLPRIPDGLEGNKAQVKDDGFGGLGHEIF